MIEEIAIVTRAGNGRVWIKSRRNGACGGCMQKESCGTATLGKLLPNRELEVDGPPDLQVGDQVRVAVDDAYLLSGSVLLYLLPLLIVFACLGLANALLPAEAADGWLPEIALVGLLLAFQVIYQLQKRLLRFVIKPIITVCK
jgi:sigma-E factor negative regulatory protein RseC